MIKFLELSPELAANNPNHRRGQWYSLSFLFFSSSSFFLFRVLHFAEGGIISGEDFKVAITEPTRDGGEKNSPALIADQIRRRELKRVIDHPRTAEDEFRDCQS